MTTTASKVVLYKVPPTLGLEGFEWCHPGCLDPLLKEAGKSVDEAEVEGDPEPPLEDLLDERCTHCGEILVEIKVTGSPEAPEDEKTLIKRRLATLKKVESELFAREAKLDVELDALIDETTDLEERLRKLNRPQKKRLKKRPKKG